MGRRKVFCHPDRHQQCAGRLHLYQQHHWAELFGERQPAHHHVQSGYHIATILAFQQFFQTRGSVAVPNFVIFDQPSQVYFPQRSRNSTLSEDDVQIADEDKQAVQKIFIAMDKFLHDTQKDVQIIVTEHADEDIWGDVSSSHLVERWRGSNDKLIPAEWITQG